jgi:hypothetical protein
MDRFYLKAGSENRTRINSLEGYGFTTKLCPQCIAFIEASARITQFQQFCAKNPRGRSHPSPTCPYSGLMVSVTSRLLKTGESPLSVRLNAGLNSQPLIAHIASWS